MTKPVLTLSCCGHWDRKLEVKLEALSRYEGLEEDDSELGERQ